MFAARLIGTMAAAACVVAALTVGEARAQAPLGFTISPTQGVPGTLVNGQVAPSDIAASCNTTVEQLQAAFAPIVDTMANDFSFIDQYLPECITDPSCSVFKTSYTYEQEAYIAITFTALGIAQNLDVGTGPAAETALPQTFVLTFANIATQQPVGDRSTFDMTTGQGSVTVPDVAPGLWAVAAACVEPSIALVPEAITAGAALLQSLGVPLTFPDENAFVSSLLDPSSDVFLGNLGPTFLVPMMTPKALGLQAFTVQAQLSRFQCYLARDRAFADVSVTLSDRFGDRSATVRRPVDVCAPSSADGAVLSTDDATSGSAGGGFLTTYQLSATGPAANVKGLVAHNDFGTVTLNVDGKPRVLMVPSSLSLTGPPSSASGAFLNHFDCYDVRVTNGTTAPSPGPVTVHTAFETVQVQPQKPHQLCVPTRKNGEPLVPSSPENLLCYKTKSGPGLQPAPTVYLEDQFGQQVQRLGQRRDLCVPTDLASPATS
jgi:hypothetical protein